MAPTITYWFQLIISFMLKTASSEAFDCDTKHVLHLSADKAFCRKVSSAEPRIVAN